MSKLEELIQELCPDGVASVSLSEVAHYSKSRIDASEVDENTYVGVENLLQNKQGKSIASSVPTSGTVIAFNCGDILIGNIRPYLKKIWLADCNGGTNGDVLTIQINEQEKLNSKFLYYVLSSDQFFLYDIQNSKGAKMPRGSKEAVMMYPVPIPPLPVQREIVRILDTFTELTAELTAELTVRKKQYEYYREKLLCEYGTETKLLGELCKTITTGKLNANAMVEDGEYPFFTCDAKPYRIDKYAFNTEAILVSGNGSQVGHINYYSGKFNAYQRTYVLADFQGVNTKYLLFYLKTYLREYIMIHSKKGSVPYITLPMLQNFKVVIPNCSEQQRIISILDRFDTLCNDLTSGLPAEIEARQKQYEYYRDKLLEFRIYNA